MSYPRSGVKIGEMALREPEVTVEAVDQDFERVLKRMKVTLLSSILLSTHLRLGFEAEGAQVGQQVTKDLELVGLREAIELQHD